MKRTVLLALVAVALALPAADSASAQGKWSRRHRHQSACKDTRGVLLGLCLTYCDALRCDERTDRRICEPLRRLYERVSRGAPVPCEVDEPEPGVCGDGAVNQPEEQCDDGNNDGCDGCSFDCRIELCGDGIVCGAEQCEQGDLCENGLACNEDCTCPDEPPPPPPASCGESAAPECGGTCPSGRTCVSRDTFCECIGTSE